MNNVGIVGATGAVGKELISILEERNFPIDKLRLFASTEKVYQNQKVHTLSDDSFDGLDIVFFSAGSVISRKYAQKAADAGAVVIDNSSAFRLAYDIPLVVPEVNPQDIKKHSGIISNPNCTTIIMLVALKPLYDYSKITNVIVSTYQSASGAGAKGMEELRNQVENHKNASDLVKVFPYQLLYNIIPQIDVFKDNGYTGEEMKMFNETRKILHDDRIRVSATCVRIPVLFSHSEAVTIISEEEITPEKARELLTKAPGVEVVDDPETQKYPMPIHTQHFDNCAVGRIRKDISFDNALTFWVSGDQIRKGAALNAVQIAELL